MTRNPEQMAEQPEQECRHHDRGVQLQNLRNRDVVHRLELQGGLVGH